MNDRPTRNPSVAAARAAEEFLSVTATTRLHLWLRRYYASDRAVRLSVCHGTGIEGVEGATIPRSLLSATQTAAVA